MNKDIDISVVKSKTLGLIERESMKNHFLNGLMKKDI